MTVSLRRLLVATMLFGAAIGLAILVYFVLPSLLGPYGGVAQGRTVNAMVTKTAACDAPDPHDTVTFAVSGKAAQARLDGCGNVQGERLAVALPEALGPRTLVEPATTASGVVPAGYRRLGFGLLALAGLAGTGYAYLVHRGGRGHRDRGSGAGKLKAAPVS